MITMFIDFGLYRPHHTGPSYCASKQVGSVSKALGFGNYHAGSALQALGVLHKPSEPRDYQGLLGLARAYWED